MILNVYRHTHTHRVLAMRIRLFDFFDLSAQRLHNVFFMRSGIPNEFVNFLEDKYILVRFGNTNVLFLQNHRSAR